MVDIQSATAEIRQGKKERKIETTGQKYYGLPYYIGDHNQMPYMSKSERGLENYGINYLEEKPGLQLRILCKHSVMCTYILIKITEIKGNIVQDYHITSQFVADIYCYYITKI